MTTTNQARVIVAYGPQCLVETPEGLLIVCQTRRKAGRPVCGDQIEFLQQDGQDAVVASIQARANSFPRADGRGRKRIVAANLDQIVVVVAPSPEPSRDLINRYLVAAESVGISAAVCINKTDLIDASNERSWRDCELSYGELGYAVCRCHTRRDGALDPLRRILSDGTGILVGQSGVGKSSIVNHLIPDLSLRTREISKSSGKGRHTTTATTLYHRPGGGDLIDSPGVWEYGIWKMSAAEIAAGFREFEAFIGHCRFANCKHLSEPDCALDGAAQAGKIAASRLASYRRIVAAGERLASD